MFKVKKIFLPFVLLSLLMIAVYSVVFYLLTVRMQLFEVHSAIDFLLPFVVSLLLFWWFPPFRLLEEYYGKMLSLFMFLGVFPNALSIIGLSSLMRNNFADTSQVGFIILLFLFGMGGLLLMILFQKLRVEKNNKTKTA